MNNPVEAIRNTGVERLMLGFSNLRETREQRPMVLTKGDGVFVTDEDGKRFLDASASFYCAALGYSNERLMQAAIRQMQDMPFYVSAQQRTVPVVIELAERLAALSPIPDAHVAFGATGSEANEFALKFMRYRNTYLGKPEKKKMISRLGSYHGGTLLTAGLGGSKTLHDAFALPMEDHLLVSQPDFFNNATPDETEADFTDRMIGEVEQIIAQEGAATIGAFVAEPLSFSAGLVIPPEGYFNRLTTLLAENDILFIDDEVITGYGRTGQMYGANTLGFVPDIMSCAKAMSGAYFPISATIVAGDIYRDLEAHSDLQGLFAHAGTYAGHPVGAAVALEMLNIIDETDLPGQVREKAPVFARRLEALADHPAVADVRTIGLAGAVQLKAEGANATAAGALADTGKRLAAAAEARGLIIRITGPSAVIAPPLIISLEEIDLLFDRFEAALDDVTG
ncbi:aminotransferase class III-fold pyridoxal phosphate-dependent enzyme [Minwuia sp.]|uniref:aminotransferase class III-fold pyridoxal phosphate-dependent enzyme n=1 Tax=Minwuia sp. TaxID=2493630 RepID=UPI003A8F7C98